MRLPFILPKAKRIPLEEKNDPNTDDRVLSLKFPFIAFLILFGAMVVLGLGMSIFEEVIEEHTALQYTLAFILFFMFGSCFIIAFISSVRVVVSDGKIVEIASNKGGKVQDWLLLTGLGVILVAYACTEGSKGNPKGAYPLYVLVGFIMLRAVFRFTLKPLIRGIAIMIRRKHCTIPVRAEISRKIETHKELSEETKKLYEERQRELPQYFDKIFVYDYCCEDQYYRMMINELYCIDSENYEYYDIYIDPDAPERYMIHGHYLFKVDKDEIKNSAILLFFLLFFTSPLWIMKFFQFIADHV